ncbi:MAG: Trm112 family protein [Propionibacteriaceae bacterium]|nr:Trm112 family protein [Propionibacteriaceae bacterium]
MVVELAPELLEILACPNCHGALAVDHERDELVCLAADCGLAYPVRDGIPVLLIDEARRPQPRPGPGSPAEADSSAQADTN